ncbi:hypothetical protein PG984_012886 [Apiospora sp. TS-2023a]
MTLALNILRLGTHNDEKDLIRSNACLGCTTGGIAKCLPLGTPMALEAGISTVAAVLVASRPFRCVALMQRDRSNGERCVSVMSFSNSDFPSVVVLVRANRLSWSTVHELRRAPRRAKWGGICHMVCNALGKPHIASWPQFLGAHDPAMNLQLPGTVGCVLKAVQTSTSIVTTTSSASTLTTTLTRTLTTTSTSYSFDRTIQSTSSRADQPSSTTLTPQPTSMTSPEAAMGKGQVAVSKAQSPTPASKLATSSGPPSVMTESGTFGTSIRYYNDKYRHQHHIDADRYQHTSSDASYFGDEYRHRGQGAASLFEVSRGTRISTNMAAISVFTTLTIIHTAQSCTIGV